MSKKDGSYSVVGGVDDNGPLSLAPRSKVGSSSSSSSSASTHQQPTILTPAHQAAIPIAQPKKAQTKKTTTQQTAAASSSSSTNARQPAGSDDDEDDEDQEEIIPKKVPDSSDSEDDDTTQKTQKRSTNAVNGDKTFMSEVDLLDLKPASFETPAVSSAAAAAAARDADRAAAEAALAAAEANSSFKPRVEWSTESTDHQTTEVFCMTWSPDSRFLAVGCGDGSIRVFNASTGKIAYLLRSSAAMTFGTGTGSSVDGSLPITCIRFRPSESSSKTKNVLLATSADGSVTHWHMMSQTCLYSIQEQQDGGDAQVYACDYRQDGEQFATGGRDGKIRLYDESTKALTSVLSAGKDRGTTGHSNRVYTVKYHPHDSNLLVSGGWDNTIQVWDCRAGYSIRSFYGPHLCGDALDLSPDGRTILTGSWRPHQTLQRWEFETGKLIDTIPFAATGPTGAGADRAELLYAASFSPDGTQIAAGGCGTNETKIFTNTSTPKMVERISAGKGGVYCLAFAPSGKKLAMGGGGTQVTVVDL